MAHFIRILKAHRLKRKWKRFQEEKEIGLAGEEQSDWESDKDDISSKFSQSYENSAIGKFIKKLKTPGTIENVVWKSFWGFVGGVILTYVFFLFFHIGINFSLKSSTYVCGIAGVILCLGMAFSSKVRCYVFLLIPVFFSRQGRQALVAYALFLSFTGPAKNTMHNMGILSDSMTCGQEMVKRTLRQIAEMVKAPFRSIKETLTKITAAIKDVVEAVKVFVTKIKRIIVSILNVIKTATTWLGSIVSFCNKKIGTPFQRCMKTFDDAITDCKAKLGVMDFMCHVVHVVKALCYTVKWLDFICMFTEFVSERIVGVVKKKLREFGLQMKNLFYVSVEYSHSYEFETTASNSTIHVAKTILQKISAKMEKFQNMIGLCGFMFSFLFIFVFFKVYYYKYKYMTSDRYDNFYISKYITELDLKRAEMDKETVLPLEPREKRYYAKPTAIRLLKDEKIRMTQSMFLLSLTSFKVISFLVCDYSLFWVLMTIYEAGYDATDDIEKTKVGVNIEGEGVLANFYRNLGKTFEVPENPNLHLNPLHCLPDPVAPDTGRYMQIGFLLGLSWFLTVMEAYGLRLRGVVMSYYYPDRARERAVWLYNHILRTRGSFVRFARRQLRRKFGHGVQPVDKVSLGQRILASFPIIGVLFSKKKENACILCATPETPLNPLKKCKTPDCRGKYCSNCFAKLENTCTICQHPIEYGDVSDISEEMDSSEEDFYKKNRSETTRTTYDSEASTAEEKFMTFRDLELRDRFRDVEANKNIDYARISDLYNDKAVIQKMLKEVIKKRIRRLEEAKNAAESSKKNEYKRIKSKLQDIVQKMKNKKTERVKSSLKKKLQDKIKRLKENQDIEEKEIEDKESEKLLPDEKQKPGKNRVWFDFEKEERNLPKSREEFRRLKEELRTKIEALKESKKKSSPDVEEDEGRNEDGDDTKKFSKEETTYYFVEKERNFFRLPAEFGVPSYKLMRPSVDDLLLDYKDNRFYNV